MRPPGSASRPEGQKVLRAGRYSGSRAHRPEPLRRLREPGSSYFRLSRVSQVGRSPTSLSYPREAEASRRGRRGIEPRVPDSFPRRRSPVLIVHKDRPRESVFTPAISTACTLITVQRKSPAWLALEDTSEPRRRSGRTPPDALVEDAMMRESRPFSGSSRDLSPSSGGVS